MNYVFYKENDGKVIATETVSEEDFNRVDVAAQYVMRIYRVEEIFHMIMSALLEFNRLIFQRADQGRIAEDDILDNELFRIRINQCAATFLTSLDMYQEYLHPTGGLSPFSISVDKFRDDRFEVCKAVRNYIQHISTVGINISWGGSACACGEKMCSFSVSADADEMKKNKDKLRKTTWKSLSKYIDGKSELNLFEIFNGVVDVLSAIQKEVRASTEYAIEYQNHAQFLSKMYARLIARDFWLYRLEGDSEYECKGHTPYFYDRQLKAIDYLRRRYRCEGNSIVNGFYATTAPQNMVNRMAKADRIVERYVKDNGVVAEFDRGNRKITSSQFTTPKMREWYLH
ncbi:MAG: hypothetical protein IKL96_09595 [Kiritimatiellae bacterium]|nr:hypothetical protein [Kiritimatiellia bacterium]